MRNPLRSKIQKVRAWLTYDPKILKGMTLTASPSFPIITPGEDNFSEADGYAKIYVSTKGTATENTDPVVIAHLKFQVLKAPATGKTVIGFYDNTSDQPHTAVFGSAPESTNLLAPNLGSLIVYTTAASATTTKTKSSAASSVSTKSTGKSSSIAATQSSSSTKSASSANTGTGTTHGAAPQNASFPLLQVQNTRATTQGNSIFLAWDVLRSSELAGYNVYYGTQMGTYIQRHSVPQTSVSYALRGLPEGMTYYLAIRAYNANNEESAFSQEVAVTVGKPETSTSPLVGMVTESGPSGKNPLQNTTANTAMPGASGLSTSLSLLLVVSAVIGTMIAYRRQTKFSTRP